MHIYIQFAVMESVFAEDYERIGEELRIFTQPERMEQDIRNAVTFHRTTLTVPENHILVICSTRYEMSDLERTLLANWNVSRAIKSAYPD